MSLHVAGLRGGVVAAPHAATVAAGRQMLAEGGNALEAMLAMAAAVPTVYPHMNHLGGDGFWLLREPSGRIRALMGAGPAGSGASIAFYREQGFDEIPARGPLAALTVPGAVGAWILAREAAHAHGGRLPLSVLLAPAIENARQGYTVTASQARLTSEHASELGEAPGFAVTFLLDGKPPALGSKLVQPGLADSLDQLARAGFEDFYRGDIGRELAADLNRIGSPVQRSDLSAYRARIAEPLRLELEAGSLFNTPPPTQGVASLLILGLFERLTPASPESFEHVHLLVEATKRAFGVRDRVVSDREDAEQSCVSQLQAARLDAEARHIDCRTAAPWPASYAKGDTVWMGAADASGLVVSYIQSLFWEFGSGCVLPRTGVLLQNRGISFSLDPRSANALAPHRRPFHTLNPALAVLNDGRIMAYGTMGGHGQPQTQAAVFTRHVRYRQPLEQALDRPRWVLGSPWGSRHTNLRVEPRLEAAVLEQLAAAGHDVEIVAEPYSDLMGHAGMVVLHVDGTLEGAHDPRADGGAAGI